MKEIFVNIRTAGVALLAFLVGLSLREAFAHEPSECPVCPVCAACPECAPPAPSLEQVQAVQRALEAIQAVEIGEDLPLGAPPPPDSPP
jgi:hypothetical protein